MNSVPSKFLQICLVLISFQQVYAQDLACRPYHLVEADFNGPEKYSKGLLWKISKEGKDVAYIFGTIHLDDQEILDLPEPVLTLLNSSDNFAMETIPTPGDAMEFSMSMFFMDGTRLDEILPDDIFSKTVSVLEKHSLSREMVTLLKPWAAYIIMSYPANMGIVLDFHLLELAQRNGAQVSGLETSSEQISIFSGMKLEHQVRILTDTVCHYETIVADFDALKKLYLNRDLEGLYVYSQQYSFGDDSIYEAISDRLISERNTRMVERMTDIFDTGLSFIAVGAMHLPGDDGILNILEKNAYTVTRVY